MRHRLLLFLTPMLLAPMGVVGEAPSKTALFKKDTDGHKVYRIPAMVVTTKGTILAFCEARQGGDFSDMELVLKRSIDNGATWSEMQTLVDIDDHSIGNPCAVVDRDTGIIHLLFDDKTTNQIFHTKSDDDGVTWSDRVEIAETVNGAGSTASRPSPGHGIQLQSGRLLMPACTRGKKWGRFHSYAIVSDDHGKTWRAGEVTGEGMNECMAVELPGGGVYMSMRHYRGVEAGDYEAWSKDTLAANDWNGADRKAIKGGKVPRRAYAVSHDEGETWEACQLDPALIDPRCQAAILRVGDHVVYGGPASTDRENYSLRLSNDSCRTWPVMKTLHAGPAAYSDLTVLADGSIGCLYECGDENKYDTITFERVELDRLVNAPPFEKDIFVGGQDGYHTYRIPSLMTTMKGTLLAFCEGRKTSRGDAGDIDLIVKRSVDNGSTWFPQPIVHEEGGDAKITIGNPCPVQDRDTGVIWAPFCRNNKRVFVTSSDDDGMTWSEPREITETVSETEWDWYATGPGVGIQLTIGEHAGRLVIPSDHRHDASYGNGSHMVYSDDHGKTWTRGQSVKPGANECQVVELDDGALMLNIRMQTYNKGSRAVSVSKDGGETWGELTHDENLPGPICQASIINATTPEDKPVLLFSNPHSAGDPEAKDKKKRKGKRINMTVKVSYDEGKSWPVARQVHPNASAYSCLTVLRNGEIGLLYEKGEGSQYNKITFARFPIEWLTE